MRFRINLILLLPILFGLNSDSNNNIVYIRVYTIIVTNVFFSDFHSAITWHVTLPIYIFITTNK